LEGLAALEDRPWATFTKGEKPITGHRLARMLKGFEIQPAGTIREDDKTFKGYRRVVFEDAFARYLGSEASHGHKSNETGAESPETEASQEEPVTVSKTADRPDEHRDCDTVTLSTPDHEEDEEPTIPHGSASVPAPVPRRSDTKTGKGAAPVNAARDAAWARADARFKVGFTS
jgi:hypothetical protein